MAKKQKISYQPLDTASTREIDAWFIIVLLVFPLCFPFGIYLMWKRTSWKTWLKILVTAIVAVALISNSVALFIKTPPAQPAPPASAAAVEIAIL
jgi:succinate dehydrogenase hydrophobic anchor subunit